MRLLRCDSRDSFSLTEFDGIAVPSYAILSHTWGADGEEVTFEDLKGVTDRSKPGYEKLRFCAKQAASDGLQYFWVDTCCIDKSNPVELQYAINSMFRWYQNAAKCYVYMSDVHSIENDHSQVFSQAAFRKSRWFTRGWILQELIAPQSVEFFTRERNRIGDKKSLEQQIHEITGIPNTALQGNPLSHFTVDERMSWVEHRETKYEEDKVYSLQGIFDLNIPLIYGEGRKRAMVRLQREIQESLKPLPVFPKGDASFIVPFDRNPNFTGRETQLTELEDKLFVGGRTMKLAITGLGGVGKTQLLLELVYRTRDKHQSCSIIWIPATNMGSLYQAYLDTARQLCIAGWEADGADVKRLVQDYLSKEDAGKWLLVFDNADDIDMWISKSALGKESSCLVNYLPRSEHGCIVFTTRDRKTAVKLAQKNVVEVPEMEKDTAILLLQKRLVNPDLVDNIQHTNALLKELTYLPLAIVQAAAYINENNIAFSEYLSILVEQEEDVIELLSEEFEDDERYQNVNNPVATTWLISFEKIRLRDPLAADYLSFMACIDSKDIPQSLLPAGQSRKKEIDAVGTLDACSFINKRTDLALDLHRLVHLATRNWLRNQNLIAKWTMRAITRLDEVFPGDDHRNRTLWRMYLPHVQYALMSDVMDNGDVNRTQLAFKFGKCLCREGRYNEAEGQFVESLSKTQRMLGQEHPSTLSIMSSLGSTYRKQGHWKEAEELEVQVVEMSKRVLGQEHIDTLSSMAGLAATYEHQGRYKEAEDLDLQVVEILKRSFGQEHPETLTGMQNLASIYRHQGRWEEATDLEIKIIEARKQLLGLDHPSTLASLNNHALTFFFQGRLEEANELNLQVMETSMRVLGHEHPDMLSVMHNRAYILKKQGSAREAIALMEECFRGRLGNNT